MTTITKETFSTELLKIIEASVKERGIERSLYDTVANQYVIEQVQTEFHCIINALVSCLLDKKLIDEKVLQAKIEENVKTQDQLLQKHLEESEKETKANGE